MDQEPLQLADGLVLFQDRAVPDRDGRRTLLLRHLAAILGCGQEHIRLAEDSQGKPHLVGPHDRLWFSLAHRGSLLLVATSWDRPVGADLEVKEPDLLATGRGDVARTFFAAGEIAWLDSLAVRERADGFLRLWTAKEAVLKAKGCGIGGGLLEPELTSVLTEGEGLAAQSAIVTVDSERFGLDWFPVGLQETGGWAARAIRL